MVDILSYVIDNFQLYYDFNRADIAYGIECNSRVSIVQSPDSTFFNEKKDIDSESVIWKEWKGKKIPFLFENEDRELFTVENGRATIHFDLIAASFYFLSGWNEYVSKERDEYGRFPFAESMICKLGIAQLPVVNYYFDILFECLSKVSKVKKVDLWGEKEFGVFLSHDIDKCMTGWRQSARRLLCEGKLLKVAGILTRKTLGRDEFFNFSKILQVEKEQSATSSFFFLRRVSDSGNIINADYNGASVKLKKEQKRLVSHENEIGVHGSFNAHISLHILEEDLRFFEDNIIVGNRFHYLKFDPLETVNVLTNSGLLYDASLGFAEEVSFRRAICYPFYLFDFKDFTSSEVIEFPLNCMDVTFQEKKYLGKRPEEILAYLKPIIAEAQKFGGVFSILWHNNNFSSIANPGWDRAYIELLEYCSSINAYQTNGKEILDILTAKRDS